nr:MAG TPA: crystallin beta/gamma motif-containing protein [Caudoviricetes sp.]
MAEYNFNNFKINPENPTGETPNNDVLGFKDSETAIQEGQVEYDADQAKRWKEADAILANGTMNFKPTSDYRNPSAEDFAGATAPPSQKPNFIDAIKDSAMDVYRNIFNGNAEGMHNAKVYAQFIGVSPQFLMDNEAAYEQAEKLYNQRLNARFMGGSAFSAEALDAMYPEIQALRKQDPVGAAIALKEYGDIKDTRGIFDLAKDAFNSGSDMVKLSDAQYRAYKGEDIDSVRPEVDRLTAELQAYKEPTASQKVLYDTIQQLTIMGTQAARATKRAAQGAALGMATSAAAAGGAAATGIGAAAAPVILMAGATTGAAYGMRVGMFEQFEQQSAAARYWELMNNRKGEYSRNHALVDSTVTGVVNGAIELGLMEVGYKPITKAWGGQAAKSILNNAAARMAIIDAGKESIAKLSAQAAMKQFGRSTAAELAEEGTQQASEDLMDNAEYYLYKKGAPHTTTEIIGNAVDAMVQAVPAVVGMGATGAITHGVGNYRGMRAVAAIKNEDWKQEYRRTVEQQTIEALMANKAQNKTAQKNPEVYKNVVQEQARLAGVQNMYVDAQELSKTDKGVDVLNDMVNRGIITGEQVDKSISTGADIVIPTGTFAQLADESVDTNTLMRATTMAKNGVHRAALEEKAKRVEAIREELANLAQNKKDVLSKELMEEHFSDADDITKTAAESVVYKNPYDLNKSYKEALADARKEYEDALGFDAYWNYKPQGVGIMYTDEESRQTGRGIRVSNNDYWYQDMYKKLGRKATREEMLDIAYEDQMKELQTLAPETADEFAQNANSLKAKYESLQGLKDKFEELAKSDYAVKQSLTKEGYEVYNEVLNRLQDGSDKSKLAANENAFIYAKMAESWARIRNEYGDTAYTTKDFMAEHAVTTKGDAKKIKGFTQQESKRIKKWLEKDSEEWEKAIDSLPNKRDNSRLMVAKHTPIVLRMLNAADRVIKMDTWKIKQVKKDHPAISNELLKKIPKAIDDPVAIFESTTHNGSLVIITDLKNEKNKANVITPIVLDVKEKKKESLIHILTSVYPRQSKKEEIQKEWFTKQFEGEPQKMPDGRERPAKAYYLNTKKITEWYAANGVQFPWSVSYQISDYFDYSIADENDLRKAKEGKILSTGQGTTFNQRAWHGSGMDFNEFNLEKALTGAGDMVHGWGIYTAKNKKTAQAYKKHAKSKGLPSYLYEVDIPEDANLLVEEKRYEEQPSEVQEKLARTISDLPDKQQKAFWGKLLHNEMRTFPEETEALSDFDKAKDKVKQLEVAANGLENTDKPKFKEKIAIKHLKKLGYTDKQIKDQVFMQAEKEKEEKVLAAVKEEAKKAEVSIQERKDGILEAAIQNPKDALKRNVGTGKEIYRYLSASLDSMEEASQQLNKNGIEGISYYDSEDGNCVVVFSDKAVNIIDKYDQEIKASYNSATGAIHLFDGADQSSFVHEAAHMYLTEMSKMAANEAAPKGLLEDWNTIQDWAAYKPEDMKDYEGTAREKEFKSYAKAIEDARKSGDAIAIRAAEERWMQERFARGFERYIAEGKAPTQALQSAFRKFKSWLVSIYRDLKNLGKEPPEDVKRVMDRILATNDEIEAWAKAKELNAWDKKGFSGDLTGSEGDMIKRWAEDAKEKAKERALKELMRQEENQWRTDLENSLEKERIDYEKHLVDENSIYGQELVYRETGEQFKEDYLRTIGYDSKESFESAIEKAGGPLEERSKAFMENRRKEYEEMMPTSEDFKNAADAELASTNAQMRLSQLEAYAIKRKVNGYVAEAVKAMRELDALDGKSEEEITAGIKEILGVDDEAAKKGRQVALVLAKNEEIQKLKERLKDAKEKDKEYRALAREELASAKAALKEAMRGLNTARDITAGSYTKTLQVAREELSKMTVAEATIWRHWEIKAKQEGNNADKLMAAGAFEEAATAKGNSLKYYCMSRAAKDNQEYVRTKLEGSTGRVDMQQEAMDGIKGMIKRISRRENPVRLDPNSRYTIQHLAYITGITEKDGIKPLNEKGEPVGINWEKVYGDLNPDYAMDKETAPNPDKIVAPWLRILAESKERKDYNEMQMDQFQDMVEAMNVLYKASRRDYEATTIKDRNGKVISQEEAALKLVQAIGVDNSFNPLQDSNNQTDAKSKAKSLAKDALLYLTKAETIFNRFGGDWMQLVYEPINQGANKELTMQQEACKTFSKIYNMYSLEEWQAMRSDRVFTIGLTTNFTREQLICMALNWGNKEGRKRVLATINKSAKNEADVIDEYTMQSVLESSLTEKDWNFIEAVWEQLDSYWAERNKVQENLYGQGLGKVQALPFNINGRQIKGGYYPIVYDPKLSIRASDLAADDIVKQALSGSSTFGIGMGSTKSRVSEVKGQQLALRLDVWPQAVTEAIHHIAMREAATDVYKLITHPAVQQAVQQKYGMETYNIIRQWSKDVWKTDVQKADIINRTLEQMRKNSAFAVMAMRTGTAILNVLNVFPMMHQIGKINTLKAITSFGLGFYKGTDTYARNRQFVFDKSPMMRDRMNTIDRDMQQDMKLEVGQDTSLIRERATHAKEKFNRFGYWFITETDLMFSMALWKHGYDESMRKQIEAGMTDVKQMEQNAISDADTNVRAVFGSGQVKDQVAMQRKNTLVGQLTPFYSYSSTVLNALIKAGYRVKDHGDYMALINATLYWVVLQTLAETVYRSAVAGELDDPDKMLRRLGITTVRNVDQGIPVVRDALEGVMNHFLLGSDSNNSPLAITAIDELVKAAQAAGNEKKDFTDVGRSLSRVGNRTWKFSDTLSDGFWNLVRFSLVDTDRSVQELITTTIFDKRYKTHEERVRQDKKKANEQKKKGK